jgi:hypothetical protein
MSNLQYRQDKIQEKHRATTREDFVAGVCSRQPITFSKVADLVSRYPNTNRRLSLVSIREFESKRDSLVNTNNIQFEHDNFFDNLSQLFFTTPQRNLIHYTENENSDY